MSKKQQEFGFCFSLAYALHSSLSLVVMKTEYMQNSSAMLAGIGKVAKCCQVQCFVFFFFLFVCFYLEDTFLLLLQTSDCT